MKKIRLWWLYAVAFFRRYRLGILVALAVVIGGVMIGLNLSTEAPKPTVSEGIIGTYTETDLPVVVTSLLSRGLVKLDSTNLPQPDIAESWTADSEVKQYTFKLKPNQQWADGSIIKAGEIAVSTPDSEISAPDDQTLIFKLADSYSALPSLLNKPVLKKGAVMSLGTGPYRIVSIEHKRDSIFVNKLELKASQPDLPNLIIRFYDNEFDLQNALRMGKVQSILGLMDFDNLISQKPFGLFSKTNHQRIVTIFYNTKDPILSDENFRLALSYAAPSIANEEVAVTSIPQNSWAFNSEVKDYLDNSAAAKTALGKVKNGKDSTITLTVTSQLKEVGERIVQEWKKQGINAVVRVESGVPQNFQALLITQKIPADPDQYSLWHSTQTQTNISQVSMPRIDKDLEDGRKIADLEKRKALYFDFQKVLLDHAPATFLYFPKSNVVYLKKIEPELKKVLNIQLNYL